MATILVGPEETKFVVHQALLCDRSQYFAKALTGSFEESKTGTVKLDDVSPMLFKIVVSWLYCGNVIYTVADDDSNIEDDFADLEAAIDKCSGGLDADDAWTWPYQVLAKLYVLADRLDIRELRNSTIDALNTTLQRRGRSLTVNDCEFVDSNTTPESPLRQHLVDVLAYRGKRIPEDLDVWRSLPHDITVEVLMRVGGRVPRELCSICYQGGLLRNKIVLDDGHPCKNEDKTPFKVDVCIYHDHADAEERKVCQANRAKTADK